MNDDEVIEFVSDTATDLAKYGLEQPKLKITFSSYSSENTAESNAGEVVLSTLEFGNSENGVTYARLRRGTVHFFDCGPDVWRSAKDEIQLP